MNEARWERLAAATGIVFFIFTFLGFVLFDVELPSPGASAHEVRTFLTNDATRFGTQAALVLIGVLFLFWWVGAVRAAIAAAEGGTGRLAGTAFGGGLALAILFLAAMGAQAQMIFAEIDKLSDTAAESLPVLFLVSDGFVGMTTVARAVLFGAMAVAAFRHHAFPVWTGWVNAVMALGAFVGLLVLIGGQGSPLDDVWFIFFISSFFWILIMSIVMTIRAGRAPAATPMMEPS